MAAVPPITVELKIDVSRLREELDDAYARVSALSSSVNDPRVFVDDERKTLVRLWASGEMEVAYREVGGLGVWGPPVHLREEK